MALKPITRQEQIIAGKNLEPVTRMERFLKEYGGGSGGGVSSWNDLKDKPFYDSPTGGDTLTWDGNTEGLVCFMDSFYKVSDAIPSYDEATNYNLNTVIRGENIIITSEEIPVTWITEGVSYMLGECVLVFVEDSTSEGATKGIYFTKFSDGDSEFVSYLTIPGYTGFPVTKKIEEKYIPDINKYTRLYADKDDPYIYSDKNFKTKVTRDDLFHLFIDGGFYIDMNDAENGTGYECPVLQFKCFGYEEYATVYIMVRTSNDGVDIRPYYSAEYTVVAPV